MSDRVIFHCDCNSFFASVETLSAPELAKVPMAVTGDPENRHGIILAKNELAKKYGIKTAETIFSAKTKCPGLICVRSHMEKYCEISKKVNAVYLDYTDLVEPFSIDESFLDVTGSMGLFNMSPKALADSIRERIRREIGITISIGVSYCKVFAKLGSDYKKPDATTVFGRDEYESGVCPLPVSSLLFVGAKTARKMSDLGIATIGDLARTDESTVARVLGDAGVTLQNYARGLDREPVRSFYEKRELKSIGNGMTFRRDIFEDPDIHDGIAYLCDEIVCRLRGENKKCTVVQVSIKDPAFRTIQRQRKLERPTWLFADIVGIASSIVRANWRAGDAIRSLTVTVSGLVPPDAEVVQLSLFDVDDGNDAEKKARQEKLEKTLDSIRRKLGRDSIRLGVYDNEDIGLHGK